MVEVVKSRLFGTALMVWASFFPIMLMLEIRDLFLLIGALTFTTSIAVLHAYWPAMKDAVLAGPKELDFVDFLTLGIMCAWFATAMRFGTIAMIWYWGQTPVTDLEVWPLAFFQYVNLTGAILHLSAKRVIKNNVPRTSWPRIFISLASGATLGAFLIVTK